MHPVICTVDGQRDKLLQCIDHNLQKKTGLIVLRNAIHVFISMVLCRSDTLCIFNSSLSSSGVK